MRKPWETTARHTETIENIRIHKKIIGKPYGNHRKTIGESLETVGKQSIPNGPQVAPPGQQTNSNGYRFGIGFDHFVVHEKPLAYIGKPKNQI